MKTKAFIYIILAGVLWGTSGVFAHYLKLYGFTAFQMTAVRASVSFLCLLIFALLKDRKLFRVKPIHLILFASIGTSLFFTASCYFLSMQMTSVSTAVVLMYTAPIYVIVFSALFMKERLTPLKLTAIIGMLVGCCLVSGIIGGLRFDASGILLGILSGIAYAAYNVLTKIAMQLKLAPVSVTLYSFAFMSFIALFFSSPKSMAESISSSPAITLPLILSLGVCTFVIPYMLYTLAMKELSAGTASALGIVEPMAATVFSVLLFKEALDTFSTVGIILILASIVAMSKTEKSPTQK